MVDVVDWPCAGEWILRPSRWHDQTADAGAECPRTEGRGSGAPSRDL